MADIFLSILNMSVSACWIVLAVLLLRIVLKKAPKWINCILWGIAGLRLVMPFSFESIFSLVPSAEFVPEEMIHSNSSVDVSGTEVLEYIGNNSVWYDLGISGGSLVFDEITAPDGNYINPLLIITYLASIVWAVGIAALLVYTLISFLNLKRKIGTAVLLRDNIYQSEAVVSPFVLGIIKPKIYLPFNMSEQDMEHVIAHEQAHIRRRDHLWKPLGFAVLTLHWFNPLVWLGYVLLCRDIELACDEKVVKELNDEQRADYSQALLTCSVNRRMIAACPLAFGEVSVKDRVKSVLNYKKPAFWIIVVAIIASVIISACFLTNPRTSIDEELSAFIDMQIAERYYLEGETDENFVVTHHKVFGVDKSLNEATVYMWAMYNEYSCESGVINNESGSHVLTVITAKKTGEHGHYELVEYWEPRDGSLYAGDVKEKIPWYLQSKASYYYLRYVYEQNEFCDNAAKEYFGAKLSTSDVGGVYESEVTLNINENEYSYIIDSVVFDIDGDGIEEECVLTYGPTSGLFTVVFSATEVGKDKADYINTFNMPYTGTPEFYVSSYGNLQLKCENHIYESVGSDRTEEVFLDIIIENDNIVLKDGDKPVEYWGEQGIMPADFFEKWNAINSVVSEAVIKNRTGKYAIDKNKPQKHPLAEAFEAHEIMHTVTAKSDTSQTLTVYALTMYEEYNLENGEIVCLGGGASPVEIVLEVENETFYRFKSYREINKPENIEDYLPEDYPDFDDGGTMESLAHSLKLDVNAYYGYIEGEGSMIHEDNKTGLTKLLVTNDEMKQMFSAFEINNTENFEFEFTRGFKRRVYHNGRFYYYCGYENEKDKVFVFFKGHEPQPVYILDFNNTFPEYKNEFGKNSKMYNEYYSMIMKIDR